MADSPSKVLTLVWTSKPFNNLAVSIRDEGINASGKGVGAAVGVGEGEGQGEGEGEGEGVGIGVGPGHPVANRADNATAHTRIQERESIPIAILRTRRSQSRRCRYR